VKWRDSTAAQRRSRCRIRQQETIRLQEQQRFSRPGKTHDSVDREFNKTILASFRSA
jgi:hypothetical protein